MLHYSDLYRKQLEGVEFLVHHEHAGLLVEVGGGKSVMSMTAFDIVRMYGDARKALVIAPLAVAKFTWATEAAKWSHLKHLRVSLVVGTPKQRKAALDAEADLYVINFDNLAWLMKQYDKDLPWDVLIIDELSKLKARNTFRYRSLVRQLQHFKYRWGLTGTPTPNHLLELWPQSFVLDRGLGERAAPPYGLGSSFTRFRESRFMQTDHLGYKWAPKQGTAEWIRARMQPLVFRASSKDIYGELPIRYNAVPCQLDKKTSDIYRTMLREMYVDLGTDVDAANAAVAVGKLLQITSGAVYDVNRTVHFIHMVKHAATCDLVEELQGEPVILVYQYQHELHEYMARLPEAIQLSARSPQNVIDDWNAGRIEVALAHSASIGHGVNLQYGGHTMVFTTQTYSAERRAQMIGRLHRNGQTQTVMIHDLLAYLDDGSPTIDHTVKAAVEHKDGVQRALLDAFEVVR